MKNHPLIVLLLFATIFAQGQPPSIDKMYKTYDQLVGLDNTGLYNGTEFTDMYLNTNGTFRYLDGFDYNRGSVVYMDQYYVGVLLKYDLLEDELLAKSDDNLGIFNVQLIKKFVAAFTLNDRHFIKLKGFDENGYFEQSYKGSAINLYIKHKKSKRKKVVKSSVQYSFKPVKYYLIEFNGKFSQVESIKNVRREFPELKSEINDFYHNHKSLYKIDRDKFMKQLAVYIDNLPKINIP